MLQIPFPAVTIAGDFVQDKNNDMEYQMVWAPWFEETDVIKLKNFNLFR